MRGCIKFSNSKVVWFTDDNYKEVLAELTDKQREQLVTLLRHRLGPRNPLPVDVSAEAYELWYEDTHRKDVMLGGGSGAESAKINKNGGKKLSLKVWHDKGDSDQNIVWLRNRGFRKRWDNNVGYKYIYGPIVLDLEWIGQLDHHSFKVRVEDLINGTRQIQ